MIKFGASMLSWITTWTPENSIYAIEKTADCGFDILEISLPASLNLDVQMVKKQLSAHGIEGRYSLILPKNCHLPQYPDQALSLLNKAIDLVVEMEGRFLGGVLHSAIGAFTGSPCTEDERAVIRDVFIAVCRYAEKNGVMLGLEPINRYESYVITAAQEVLDLAIEVQSPALGLMLDTFHMNIEESNFYDPVVLAGNRLKYVHMTESNRGMLGEGNVHWDDFFRGLAQINYTGDLVLENFSSQVSGMSGMTSLWRPSKYDAAALAKGSLHFMKQKAQQWGLNTRFISH
ncbi:sugar phosphate isomerase/epimerase family protein [Pedobacter heparinus]|uniref:Xylose isomerase domain protein TIM barrel n=1 Tax=Pedobacter heparinus (strain ATCC 13125 / DSM 2366 / CIP 104194 / JCM 7457 / NBRC 12017 / NCIMB 9290 / NRRL B-14731 / HIM 762-3) TaxID=485917 RepID=C6XUU3_PEDHD|nr:sugar phosphate isomerase/epimerase [Pedobacter heparinus]ACU05951.1 Xylose isomerase domain protein TIM barrel [Pedobacter heparinus DSM 2366]